MEQGITVPVRPDRISGHAWEPSETNQATLTLATAGSRLTGPTLPHRLNAIKVMQDQAAELRAWRDRMVREMAVAQQVQLSMLPARMPELGSVRFGAALRPCEHLAGDFYNVFRLDRDHLGLYLGDVMGHGAPAALLSVYAMQNLTTKRIEGNNYEIVAPSQALSQLNDDLLEAGFPGDPFVTMIYGVLEVPTLRLTFCNAGHPPAYLLRCSTGTQVLEPTRLPLGIGLSDYCDEEITLEPGDRLVLWSDGVDTLCWPGVGARGAALASFLAQDNDATPQQQIDRALACAQSLPGVSDDVALLMLRVG